MKKTLLLVLFVFLTNACFALPLPSIPDPFTGTLKGESEFYRSTTGETIYADWIVSTQDLASNIDDSNFVFSILTNDPGNTRGNKALYNASTYYYYYQLENDNVNNNNVVNAFSLDLDPDVVVSAGYITDVDLDLDLLELHNLTGEAENNTNGEVDPSQSNFTPIGTIPHQNWQWNLGLGDGEESTVLFLTCYMPPEYSPASALSGSDSYDGYLPIPGLDDAVPEPISIVLLGSSLLALFHKKKK